MNTAFIARLRCPYTGSPFSVELASGDDEIEFGVVTSEAGSFPVIAGVLRLLADDLRAPLLELVRRGRHGDALRGALEVPSLLAGATIVDQVWRRIAQRGPFGPAARTATLAKRRLYDAITRSDVSFVDAAAAARGERWTNWQTHRFSMQTFQPVYALAHLATGCRTIFDFGCGLAHSAFLMQRFAGDAEVVCGDYSFTSMYLAKRFIVADAECICLDGDFPLPFADGYFDLVFSTDALQYIQATIGLAREFRRIMRADGTIALAHLHNRRSAVRAGEALTAGGYDALFDGMSRRLYPEDSVVCDYVADETLHLERRWDKAELDAATNGLSLVAANSDRVFTRRDRLVDRYIDVMRHPEVNPAYLASPSGNGSWSLERRIGAPYAVERTIGGHELLPRTGRADVDSLVSDRLLAARTGDRATLRELVRRLLVLDVPESYLSLAKVAG